MWSNPGVILPGVKMAVYSLPYFHIQTDRFITYRRWGCGLWRLVVLEAAPDGGLLLPTHCISDGCNLTDKDRRSIIIIIIKVGVLALGCLQVDYGQCTLGREWHPVPFGWDSNTPTTTLSSPNQNIKGAEVMRRLVLLAVRRRDCLPSPSRVLTPGTLGGTSFSIRGPILRHTLSR